MKVLLISDLAATGFGRVGRELATGLIGRGHDVHVIGINYRGVVGEFGALLSKGNGEDLAARIRSAAATVADDPLVGRIIPADRHGDGGGYNLTGPALEGQLWPGWTPEAAIIVADPKAMLGRLANDGGAIGRFTGPVLNYIPVEGVGAPPSWRTIWQHVQPVAMSRFGQGELETLLGRPVPLAYHGVSAAFRPVSPSDPATINGRTVTSRDGAKEAIGQAGRTVILRTDRFVFRKNYPAFFRIVRPILAAHPEAVAIVHSPLPDDDGRGDLRELVSREPGALWQGGLDWTHPQIVLTRAHDSFRGLSDEELRVLYSAADVYLSPTMAEGFGLCLAEALACETPVIANEYSAVGEVVGPGGILTAPVGHLTNAYAHEWSLADEPAMTAALERLVRKPALRRELGAAGRRHISRFTWSAAVDVFDALLATPAAVAA